MMTPTKERRMNEEVLTFLSNEGDGYKEYVEARVGSYVLAGPREPSTGQFTLHTARCMHIRDNKTARLIAPGEVRIVAPTVRSLVTWVRHNQKRRQGVEGCKSCKTTEIVKGYVQ